INFWISLSLILVSASCGKYEVTGKEIDRIGQPMSNFLTVSSADRTQLRRVCQALSTKEMILPQLEAAPLKFNISQKDCSAVMKGISLVEVTVQNDSSGYVFKRVDNQAFPFPRVLVTSSQE